MLTKIPEKMRCVFLILRYYYFNEGVGKYKIFKKYIHPAVTQEREARDIACIKFVLYS